MDSGHFRDDLCVTRIVNVVVINGDNKSQTAIRLWVLPTMRRIGRYGLNTRTIYHNALPRANDATALDFFREIFIGQYARLWSTQLRNVCHRKMLIMMMPNEDDIR